jgi:lactoylglutathione lyase
VPPLNHIGLWVDHLPEAVAWLTNKGVRFTPGGVCKGADGREIAFIHPKASAESPIGGEGVMIELVQATPDVIAAFATINDATP